jgi:hypothetical protein
MADYKGIKGFKVQYLSADPSNPIIGQTWYNDTSKDLKYTGVSTAGSWATGNNMNTARTQLAGCGTQTAGLAFGGFAPAATGATEEYDGNSWTTSPGSLGTARSLAGCGTQTAALGFGGDPPPTYSALTEEYDGSTWSPGGNLGTARRFLAGAGTQTAGLAFGGDFGPPAPTNATEEYNGTSWTTWRKFKYSKRSISRLWNSNSRFSIWWLYSFKR